MERKLAMTTGGVVGLIAATMLWNLVFSPMDAARAALEEELAKVPTHAGTAESMDHDFTQLHEQIAAKPALWQELIAPPAPPAPKPAAPPPPPSTPDVAAMLQDLGMAPGQIGKLRMKVITPANPRGDWMKVGDSYNGCRLLSFTREEAVFSYLWKEKNQEITVTLPRPLR